MFGEGLSQSAFSGAVIACGPSEHVVPVPVGQRVCACLSLELQKNRWVDKRDRSLVHIGTFIPKHTHTQPGRDPMAFYLYLRSHSPWAFTRPRCSWTDACTRHFWPENVILFRCIDDSVLA